MSSQPTTKRQRPIRVLVSKLGLDGHDRGALIICRGLRDAGMEVIYSGLFCTPQQVANIAIEEDVDVVAMSLLNGAHLTLFPKVKALLDKQGAKNILVLGGGIIPKKDKELLETKGVYGNFGPGTPLGTIVDYIKTKCKNF
jgi:methylmalonyl-CoA mutase C-terminal domain/subunit